MTMELNLSSSSSSASASASPQLITSYGFFYGVPDHQNAAFYSPPPVMPLKFDGSLCIMESPSGSLPQVVTSSTPKLEDFFGGTTMGVTHHQYENNNISNGEAMALSLNSMFYHQPNSQEHDQHHIIKSYHNSEETNDRTMAAANNDNVSSVCVNNNSAIMGCGDLKSLSLSMSPGSQTSCVTASGQVSNCMLNDCINGGHVVVMDTKKRERSESGSKAAFHRKSLDTFGQRTSQYRGVTRHRWTGRYEAHLWDNSCKKEGQSRKGRQVYLGGYDLEEKAGRAYDLAALKYWGASTHTNFPFENYQKEMEEMKNMSRQEYVAHLRRKSSGFSRGASIYRGVTRHHQHGRWQARIGRVAGNKDLYLGTFSTQEEAAEAYDIAAIKFRGLKAVTNFDITRYDAERIMSSNTLLAGDLAKRNIDKGPVGPDINDATAHTQNSLLAHTIHGNTIRIGNGMSDWKTALYPSPESLSQMPGSDENYQLEAVKHAPHLSNQSTLVTGLSGSREDSALSSWITCNQQAEMPLFAAWNDA